MDGNRYKKPLLCLKQLQDRGSELFIQLVELPKYHTIPEPQCIKTSSITWLQKGTQIRSAKEALNKSISFMVRQAHHERNQQLAVHPEPVEGLNQRFPKSQHLLLGKLKLSILHNMALNHVRPLTTINKVETIYYFLGVL